ncbi:hypothetical protein [Streptomyces sp. URMC 124]|uniref:hypothetical protein n=1 Tax=Streptomyces sp. URMC 124 TaxID=3423405 RepID=UPI003F1A985F
MTDRIRLDDLNDNDLDQLYDERDLYRGFQDLVRTELNHWHPTESPRILRTELRALDAALGPRP